MKLIPLRAGPLTLVFHEDEGCVSHVHAGGHEVLRGLGAPVRDAVWATTPPRVRDVRIAQNTAGFRVSFTVECRSGAVDFVWAGELTGMADGRLEFRFDGEARARFWANRIGFTVLHPAEAAGRAVRVEHVDGSVEEAVFPGGISPHQPFLDVRALAHEFAPGLWAETRMSGDVFETEDQRNWTDASFKTYCTPLDRPHPVALEPGRRIRQRVSLRLMSPVPPARAGFVFPWEPEAWAAEDTALPASRPAVGVCWTEPCPDVVLERLRSLGLAHLRVDLWLANPGYAETLRAAARDAARLNTALELAVFVGSQSDDRQREALRRSLRSLTPAPSVARWLVFDDRTGLSEAATLERWREAFRGTPFAAPVGGGTVENFAELNRNRGCVAGADFSVHGCNPQYHVFDDLALRETLPIQGLTVREARRISGGLPVVVSPVAFTRRWRAGEAGAPADAAGRPAFLMPFKPDARLGTAFAAEWLAGSVRSLAQAGAVSVTLGPLSGSGGLLDENGGPGAFALPAALVRLATGGGSQGAA